MQHLETLIQAIPPAVFAAGPLLPPLNTTGQVSTSTETTSPLAPFLYPQFPPGVPPPSLDVFPLTNPSTHFTAAPYADRYRYAAGSTQFFSDPQPITPDQLAEETSRMSLSASYLYFDDEGYTRWQGETSGLPVLDLLVERHKPSNNGDKPRSPFESPQPNRLANTTDTDWFPDRTPRRTDINPQTLWRMITSSIVPELMDR